LGRDTTTYELPKNEIRPKQITEKEEGESEPGKEKKSP